LTEIQFVLGFSLRFAINGVTIFLSRIVAPVDTANMQRFATILKKVAFKIFIPATPAGIPNSQSPDPRDPRAKNLRL
jgi:hypothetical protein